MEKQDQVLALEAKIQSAAAPKEIQEPEATPAEPVDAPKAEAVEAPPAAVVEDHDEDDHEESAPSDGSDVPAHRKNKGVGKRINELTREKYEAIRRAEQVEAEREYWREQAQRAQQQPPEQPQHRIEGKPTLEAYGYDQEAYEEARDAWVINQAQQSWSQQQQQQQRATQFQERIRKFEAEVPGGWQATITAPFDPSEVMLEAIAESEIGPKVAHYLTQHLDEAHSLKRLSPFQQAIAMGRIEAKLLAPQAAPVSRPPQQLTRAPAPPPSLPSGTPSGRSSGSMGMEDHIAAVLAKKKAKYG